MKSRSARPVSGLGASPRWMRALEARPMRKVLKVMGASGADGRPSPFITNVSPRFSSLMALLGVLGVLFALVLVLVLEVVLLVLELVVHHRLDGDGLLGDVRQGLDVALVRLLVEGAGAQVALGGPLVEV